MNFNTLVLITSLISILTHQSQYETNEIILGIKSSFYYYYLTLYLKQEIKHKHLVIYKISEAIL